MMQYKEPQVMTAKLPSVCATVMVAGLMLVQSGTAFAPAVDDRPSVTAASPHDCMHAEVGDLVSEMLRIKGRLEWAQKEILSGQVPHDLLRKHPFERIAGVMDAGFKEMLEARRAGDLDAEDENLIQVFAETLAVAKQNIRLINQALREPKTFESALNRDGLVMLARMGREASSRSNA
ncbi:MAG: hypothetical protein ACRBBM_10955 [Pseudomonadaceae bacterium]|jgi:hypothetical protein